QIVGILYTGIHALAAGGTMDMRRIAGQEDTSIAEMMHLAARNMESRQPERLPERDVSRPTRIDQGLHVCQCQLSRGRRRGIRRQIGYDPISASAKGKEAKDAILMEAERDFVIRERGMHGDICQDEGLVITGAGKGQA